MEFIFENISEFLLKIVSAIETFAIDILNKLPTITIPYSSEIISTGIIIYSYLMWANTWLPITELFILLKYSLIIQGTFLVIRGIIFFINFVRGR